MQQIYPNEIANRQHWFAVALAVFFILFVADHAFTASSACQLVVGLGVFIAALVGDRDTHLVIFLLASAFLLSPWLS